jgi:hypothetical protein
MKEGVIRPFRRHGYSIEGGSLVELRSKSPGADTQSDILIRCVHTSSLETGV